MITVNQMQQRTAATLSTTARVGYTLVALCAAAMATLTGALVATESSLPTRTQVALTAMTVIGVAWTVVALWVLRRRRVLLARHRIVVTTVACVVCGAFLLGALALQSPLRTPTLVVAAVMCLLAIAARIQAQRAHTQLIARRDALMKERA